MNWEEELAFGVGWLCAMALTGIVVALGGWYWFWVFLLISLIQTVWACQKGVRHGPTK